MSYSHARISKSLVAEREISLVNYDEHHCADHFYELRRLIDGDTKLHLEVEIDESLCELLSSPQEHRSDLLDVTIIKQSKSFHETTVSLGLNEVSDFIEMVNYHNERKGSIENNERCTNTSEAILPQNQREELDLTSLTDDFNAYKQNFPQTFPDKTAVYTTPYTFDNVKKKLPCLGQPTHETDKPGTPCLCQHCGMVGVLVESQKRPAIPHTPNPKFSKTKQSQRSSMKRLDIRVKSNSETNITLIKELCHKIATLETRFNEHEEKTVRKDYFKFVIHKLLTQYSNKINEIKQLQPKPGINMSTQYSKTNKAYRAEQEEPEREKYKYAQYNSKNIDSGDSIPKKERKHPIRSKPPPREDIFSHNYNMKSKIANLLEEKKNPKSHKELRTERHRDDVLKLPPNMDDIKTETTPKHIFMANHLERNPFKISEAQHNVHPLIEAIEELDRDMSSQTIKKLYDIVYSKYYEKSKIQLPVEERKYNDDSTFKRNIQAQKEAKGHKKPDSFRFSDIPDKLLKSMRPASKDRFSKQRQQKSSYKDDDHVDVSYMNPAVKSWCEEGSSEDMAPIKRFSKKANRHSIEEKIKYLKTLAKKKNVDEAELWTNILNQAKKHIKSNEDTVSIQLPGGFKNTEMSELELTLSNLKEIVRRSHNVKKNKSCLSIELNYRTSSDNYIKKKEHKDFIKKSQNKKYGMK